MRFAIAVPDYNRLLPPKNHVCNSKDRAKGNAHPSLTATVGLLL